MNSLIQQKFSEFIITNIMKNNDKVEDNRGYKFEVLPKIAFLLIQSLSQVINIVILLERYGRFTQLIKSSKKKRSGKIERINKDKKEQEYINCVQEQEDEIDKLKEELRACKSKLDDYSKDTDLLKKLYDDGYIGLDGNPIEREQDMR